MANVSFTTNLRRHVGDADVRNVAGATVREVLDAVFALHPRVRAYVLDDQGALRHHMSIFVDGEQVRDRSRLSDPVRPDAELHVMQALSGGSL